MARSIRSDPRPDNGLAASPGRFDLLLVVMVSVYLLSALTNGRWIDALRILLFTVAALLALRGSLVPRRTARLILVAVLAGSAIMLTLSFTTETGSGIASVWAGLVLLFAVLVIVHRVLSVRTVTAQNIYGAVSAYLMIGVAFAAFFAAIDHLSGGHFFAQGHPDSTQTFQYFSFTTLTTLGYGDFTATGNFGRALADLEALTGQIFLVTLVAFLVARFRAPGEQKH
jgi:Ion channel